MSKKSLAYINGNYVEIEDTECTSVDNGYTPVDYGNVVEEFIRQRYSVSQELAIQRQKDAKPEEYIDYYDYCEECKAEAKRLCKMEHD